MLSLFIFCCFIWGKFLNGHSFIIHRQNHRADWKLYPHEWVWSMSSYGDKAATWLSWAVYLEALSLWNFKLSRKNLRVRGRRKKAVYVWLQGLWKQAWGTEWRGKEFHPLWHGFPFFLSRQRPHSTHICAPCLKSSWLELFGDSTCSLSLGMVKRSRDSVPGGRMVT